MSAPDELPHFYVHQCGVTTQPNSHMNRYIGTFKMSIIGKLVFLASSSIFAVLMTTLMYLLPCFTSTCLPYCIESHSLALTGRQDGYERQVRYLGSSPAKLEDHHERGVIDKQGPVVCASTIDTLSEEEREGTNHTYGT